MNDMNSDVAAKQPVFPGRVDHVYCISIDPSESEREVVYIGQSVTPGRALKHFKSHNSKLQQRLAGHEAWRISFQNLEVASAEDTNIFESLAIDLVKHDGRFNSVNGLEGSTVFRPRAFYPQHNLPVKNGIYVRWEWIDGVNRALEVTDIAPSTDPAEPGVYQRWWVTPSLRSKNLHPVLEGIRALIKSVEDQGAVRFQNPYFQYLADMGLDAMDSLPAAGRGVTLQELYKDLSGSFVYVQINDKVFEDVGDTRTGLQPGLGHDALKDRVEKFWDKSSSSLTSGRTLSRLLTPEDRALLADSERPRFLVGAVSGTKIILGIWKLDIASTESWLDPGQGKVVFPITDPASKDLLATYVGARIGDHLDMNSKAVKWIDVAPSM